MLELTEQMDFESVVLNSDIPVLVDFFTDWCMPCKMLSPILEEISSELNGKLNVIKVNIEKDFNAKLADTYGIRGVPTMMVFKAGKVQDTIVGAMSKEMILERLKVSMS